MRFANASYALNPSPLSDLTAELCRLLTTCWQSVSPKRKMSQRRARAQEPARGAANGRRAALTCGRSRQEPHCPSPIVL